MTYFYTCYFGFLSNNKIKLSKNVHYCSYKQRIHAYKNKPTNFYYIHTEKRNNIDHNVINANIFFKFTLMHTFILQQCIQIPQIGKKKYHFRIKHFKNERNYLKVYHFGGKNYRVKAFQKLLKCNVKIKEVLF